MVYNTGKLSPSQLPKSVMDLADPAWKGKIGIAPGETDFQPIVTSILKEKGKAAALAWLKGSRRTPAVTRIPTTRRSPTW